jgi:uncharacterized protein YgiM (DUF1202 family)
VRQLGTLVSLLMAAKAGASIAYVSDELVLGVYAEQTGQGQRLATLHSGAGVETLGVNGEFTQVRLNDGTIGWVKSAYLTTQEPAKVRLKHLEEELDRSRATTPALAEAAARSELEQLKGELAAKQAELDAALVAGPAVRGEATGSGTPAKTGAAFSRLWIAIPAVLAALAGGFWLGYATLAHRIRQKFGGLKVY